MTGLVERRNLRRRGREVGDARVHHHHAGDREPAQIAQGKAGSPPRAGGLAGLPCEEGRFAALRQDDARRPNRSDGAEENARRGRPTGGGGMPARVGFTASSLVVPIPSSPPDEFDTHVSDVGPRRA